jgi:hypothetical protein
MFLGIFMLTDDIGIRSVSAELLPKVMALNLFGRSDC